MKKLATILLAVCMLMLTGCQQVADLVSPLEETEKTGEERSTVTETKPEETEKTEITVTHDKLAAEINSSREVVSRTLKNMEKQNLLRLGRGRITVLDKKNLSQMQEK